VDIITVDTPLSNGATIRELYEQARKKRDSLTQLAVSSRRAEIEREREVGRIQGYFTMATLLGIDMDEVYS
jgi:hypothetical protein